jgi:hypothetical protein
VFGLILEGIRRAAEADAADALRAG